MWLPVALGHCPKTRGSGPARLCSEGRSVIPLPGRTCMLSRFGRVQLCNSMDCSPPGSLSTGFSRQEDWSGLPCLPGHLSATLWGKQKLWPVGMVPQMSRLLLLRTARRLTPPYLTKPPGGAWAIWGKAEGVSREEDQTSDKNCS